MRRIIFAVVLFTISAFASANEIPWRSQSLSAAKELCRSDPSKHILVFYTDYRTWAGCRYVSSVLSGGEVKNRYSKDFIIVESKPTHQYPENHELRLLTKARYTPNFVFLDYRGKRVFQTRGFNNEHEAIAIHEFVSSRAYKTAKFADYTATRPVNWRAHWAWLFCRRCSDAQWIAAWLGKQVVVENRTGASTMIGGDSGAESPPDGHVLQFAAFIKSELMKCAKVVKDLPEPLELEHSQIGVYDTQYGNKEATDRRPIKSSDRDRRCPFQQGSTARTGRAVRKSGPKFLCE